MKKFSSLIISLCMVLQLFAGLTITVNAAGGTCGTNLTWTLDDAGTLTISGTGAMTNWEYSKVPWRNNKDRIKKVIINNGVTTISDYAFYENYNLASVSIGNSVTTIGESAFYRCSLTSIDIPNSVTTIADYAFGYCYDLTSVTIGNNVTTIGDYAFYHCSLTSIDIPNSVTTIGESPFGYCESLTSVTIGNNVTTIGDYAFKHCGISSIKIPNSVITIGIGAFGSCKSLTSIYIPNSVTTIEDETFYGCSHLTDVYYSGTEDEWNNITIIGSYNVCLDIATIHFAMSAMINNIIITDSSVPDMYNVDVSDSVVPSDAQIFVASYSKTGTLLETKMLLASNLSVYLAKQDVSEIKAFVWDGSGLLKPLCESFAKTVVNQ